MKFFTSCGSMPQMGAGMVFWRLPVTARKPGMAIRPAMAAMAAAIPAPTELVLEVEPKPGLPGFSEGLSSGLSEGSSEGLSAGSSAGSSGWPAESSAPRVNPVSYTHLTLPTKA